MTTTLLDLSVTLGLEPTISCTTARNCRTNWVNMIIHLLFIVFIGVHELGIASVMALGFMILL